MGDNFYTKENQSRGGGACQKSNPNNYVQCQIILQIDACILCKIHFASEIFLDNTVMKNACQSYPPEESDNSSFETHKATQI